MYLTNEAHFGELLETVLAGGCDESLVRANDAAERHVVRDAHLEQDVQHGEHECHEAGGAAAASGAVRALGALVPVEREAGHAVVGDLEAANALAAEVGAASLCQHWNALNWHEGESGALAVEHMLRVETVHVLVVHRRIAAQAVVHDVEHPKTKQTNTCKYKCKHNACSKCKTSQVEVLAMKEASARAAARAQEGE